MSGEMNAADWFRLAHEAATDQVRPWRVALFVTNFLWAASLVTLLFFAYFNPVEVEQQLDQNAPGYSQKGKQYQGKNE